MKSQPTPLSALRYKCIAALLAFLFLPAVASETDFAGRPTVMSLNIYGYKTMPREAGAYAALAERHGVDVLAIQEGVDDWQIGIDWPEDYSRSEQVHKALGDCWERRYQIFANRCRGYSIERHERFDLADGPNAVRTGEKAHIEGPHGRFILLNVHWDHQSEPARLASARQTADAAADSSGLPMIILGDFNSPCSGPTVQGMVVAAGLRTAVDGGIDCIFLRAVEGIGEAVNASPSDHPAVLVRLEFKGAGD
jgi:hypothetical protein